MTDQELELELNEAGTRLGDPPSSVDDLLGILDETSVSKGKNDKEQSGGQSSGATRGSTPQPPDFEAKVAKLTELGFGRDAVIQALQLFNGNEEQAAGYLFGGIEPWTFVQQLGETVFIPAGCPHQVRNLKGAEVDISLLPKLQSIPHFLAS